MVLSDTIKKQIKENIDTMLKAHEENRSIRDSFRKKWKCENEHDFLHGLWMGEIKGDARMFAKLTLNRSLTADEVKELNVLTDKVNLEIKDIVTRLRFN